MRVIHNHNYPDLSDERAKASEIDASKERLVEQETENEAKPYHTSSNNQGHTTPRAHYTSENNIDLD